MYPFKRYPVLLHLLRPFRRSQQKTIALFAAALVDVAEARSLALATHLAVRLRIKSASVLRSFYRLLANPRIDDQLLVRELLRLLSRGRGRLLIAIDWTEWHSGLRMLLASVIVGSRALPAQTFVGAPSKLERSQNAWEDAFIQSLQATLSEIETSAVLLFDRGFRRASLIALLQELKADFIVRLVSNVSVRPEDRAPVLLSALPLRPGDATDLGWVALRADGRVRVRIVGIWARGQREPWWLATNLTCSLSELAALYDRRMGIEEQFRDSKGTRFGVRLRWTQFRTPAHLARLTLLVGIALLIWTAAGHAATEANPELLMPERKKGPRLSLVRIGIYIIATLPNLFTKEFIQQHTPPPRIRLFPWLQEVTT